MNVSQKLSTVFREAHLENRPQQNLMASAIEETLETGGFLMVEAGTGVGKSFAYLLPAIEYALKQGGPVVVSTHTLTLQEQLFHKDLPLVLKAVNEEGEGTASAILMKGRGNYLSRRRLKLALENNAQLDIENGDADLVKVLEWSLNSTEGTVASLPFPIRSEVWGEIKSDPYHCLGSKCPTYDSCFFYTTRRRAGGAHLILVNHALLLADLALKMEEEQGVLPPYEVLIVDEAHHFPALATEHLGTAVTHSECMGLVKRLLFTDEKSTDGRKGLFTLMPVAGAGEAVMDFKKAADEFFTEIGLLAMKTSPVNRAYPLPEPTPNIEKLSNPLGRIESLLELAERSATSEELGLEARGTREECRALVRRLSNILQRAWGDESCYVVEPDANALRKGEVKAASIKAIPLDASGLIREHLLSSTKSVIFTSATLSVGNDFGYFKHALGLDDPDEVDRVKTLAVGSPFNYKKQVTLFLPRSMPHPRQEEEKYIREVIEYTKASLKHSHGKAFVLFTSNKMMRQVAEAVRPTLDDMNITMLVQGEDGWDRTKLLKTFREDINSVLFGVNSFWEGVDVPGEALSNLIITKLPFQVPEGPLVEARHARLKEQGLHPFQVESLPEAVLRLKQGFGRLIRSASDVGTVTLLDPRVTTERWGKVFLNALPECETVFLAKPGTPEKVSPRRR